MANNLNVSEGTGKVVATDDVAGVHYQVIKLAGGTEDAAERIEGTAANGLEVDVTRVKPGSTFDALGKQVDVASVQSGGSADVGVAALAVRTDSPGALTPANGDYVQLRVDANGRLYVNLDTGAAILSTVTQTATAGGSTPTTPLVAASGINATSVKASSGQVYGYYAFNASANVRYIRLVDKASAPSMPTDGGLVRWVIALPAGAAANMVFNPGLVFGTGVAFVMTSGIANNDSGNVTASDLVFSLAYK